MSTHIITQKGYLIIFSPVTNQNYLLSISFPKTLTLRPQQRNYTASVFFFLGFVLPSMFSNPCLYCTGSHWGEWDVRGKFSDLCRNSVGIVLSELSVYKCDYIHAESYGQLQHREAKNCHTIWDLHNQLTLRLLLLYVIGSEVFPLIFQKPLCLLP